MKNFWAVLSFLYILLNFSRCQGQTYETIGELTFECPKGWKHYGGNCYFMVDVAMGWSDAKDTCTSYEAKFLTIDDEIENMELSKMATTNTWKSFWVGEKVSEDVLCRGYWDNYQPPETVTDGECIIVNARGFWEVQHCEKVAPFFCKKPACLNGTFDCGYGRCISSKWVCDGVNDCDNNMDEMNCDIIYRMDQNGKYFAGTDHSIATYLKTDIFHCKRLCLNSTQSCVAAAFNAGQQQCYLYSKAQADKKASNEDYTWLEKNPARCSYYKTESTGTLPQLIGYDNNADCLWTIEGPVGSQLKLTFSNVSTELNADIIEVRSGSKSLRESSLVKTLSGDLTNQVIYSTNNFLIIRFTTDTTVKSSGFQAAWTSAVPELSRSVRNVAASSSWQELMTPFYPNTPPQGFRLEWHVSSTENAIITFEVVEIDLSSSWELLLYDGETFGRELLKASKDSTLRSPAVYMSSANKLRILLRLKGEESVVTGKGIKIRVKEGCSVSVTAAHGKVYSPGFDRRMYPTSTKCDWTIMAPNSSKRPLQLKFLFFDLADDIDNLKVYSGHNSSGSALHPSPGFKGNLTSNLTTLHGGNILYLLFESSLIQANGGFILEFSIDCPEIPPSSDLILSTNSSQYEVEVMITCTEGYSFVQEEYNQISSLSFMCKKAGMWNETRYPTCQITYCGVPKATPNGFIANYSGAVTYQSQVTYECYPGFQMKSSATVSCQANGKWEKMPSCESSTCSTAPLVANATTNNTVGDGTSYGTIVKYTCEDGFELLGASQILCQTSGNWSHSPPSCIPIKCPIPKIPRGTIDPSEPVNFQDAVKLTCQKGYVASTSKQQSITLTCGANGKFEDVECEDENECTRQAPCISANKKCRNTFGSYECPCRDGYTGSTCSDINECSEDNGGCDHKCENSVPPYACFCNEGYTLFMSNGTNNRSIEKGETGLRSGDVYYINHTCVPNICNRPPDLGNGTIHSKRELFYFKDKLKYSCNLGWTLKGSSVRTCLKNGNWSGTEPSCEEVFCPPLEIVGEDYNKARVVQISPNTSVAFGEKVILQCRRENNNILSKTLYCAYDVNSGNYSLQGDTPKCPVIDCKTPDPGAVKPSVSTLMGSSFEFECSGSVDRVGESSLGNFTVECQSNGLWGLNNLTCKAPRCSDPGTPGGSVQIVRSYEEGQMLIYNCTRDGYEPNPSTPLWCQIVGHKADWNGSVPQCKDATKPVFSNCPKETIYVDLMEAAGFNAPTATDNSGLLKFLVVNPASFDPMQPITGNTTVTYTAGDWEGNNETCVVMINLKDRTLPMLSCPDFLVLNVSDTSARTVNLAGFVSGTGNVSVLPSIDVSLKTYKHVLDHRVSTKSAAGYVNTCAFQTEIQASKCFKEILNSLSGADVKFENVSDNLVVMVTCKDGYALDGGSTSKNYNCTGENKWSPVLPLEDCIVYEPSIYTLKFTVTYKSTAIITQDCVNSHADLLNSSLSASNLNEYCWRKDGISKYKFTASEIKNVDVEFLKLTTNVTLRILNNDGDATKLKSCQDTLSDFIDQIFSYSGFGCGNLTLDPDAKNVLDADASGDSCSSGLVLSTVGSNKQCLPCVPGTYSSEGKCLVCPDGQYQDKAGQTACKNCPDNKASLKPRISESQCIKRCTDGFISDTGIPPCRACQKNYYWKNPTKCEPCPNKGSTHVSTTYIEGASSVSSCQDPCSAGSYSVTGFGPCTKCPRHFYSNESGMKSCIECSPEKITEAEGKTFESDCIEGNSTLCNNNSCSGHGSCSVVNHRTSCLCSEGYSGSDCSIKVDHCESNPCLNGGKCESSLTGYTCECAAETECKMQKEGNFDAGRTVIGVAKVTTLSACQQECLNIENCVALAFQTEVGACGLYAKNHITAKEANEDYDWFNKICQYKYYFNGTNCQNDLRNDCKNDTCSKYGMCQDLINDTKCLCPTSGSYGMPGCEISSDICKPDPCQNNGTCIAYGAVRFQCVCPAGFTGTKCETKINECENNPSACLYGGKCQAEANRYTCKCSDDFSGDNCENWAVFCKTGTCANGLCVNDYSSQKALCVCEDPYKIGPDGKCVEINYCDKSRCVNGSTCEPKLGGFECRCPEGMEGSLCQHNIDDCLSNPCQNGTCMDGLNTFSCNCTDGFTGKICDENTDDCPGGCHSNNTEKCIDLVQDYKCMCKSGYTGKTCSELINECDSLPCQHGGVCKDLMADYECNCTEGWTGKSCETPSNFCQESKCKNGGECSSLLDDFFCSCKPGTQGKTCGDSPGVCSVLAPCAGTGTCKDGDGTATCTCQTNYTGVSCQLIEDTCSKTPCSNDGECTPKPVGYECSCKDGFSGLDCKTSPDICAIAACASSTTCNKIDGKAYCLCSPEQARGGSTGCKVGNTDFDLWIDARLNKKELKSSSPFMFDSSGNMTLMLWIGFIKPGTSIKIKTSKISVLTLRNDGVIFAVKNESKKINITFSDHTTLKNGRWNHVAITWTSSGSFQIFINGLRHEKGMVLVPTFQNMMGRVELHKDFMGFLSQVTVWRSILTFNEILKALQTPRHMPSGDLAYGWTSYDLPLGAQRLSPSKAKQEKLCEPGRYPYDSCNGIPNKKIPKAINCPNMAKRMVSEKRTIQVIKVFEKPKFDGSSKMLNSSLSSDLMTWGAYSVIYGAEDSDGNIGVCRFKTYILKEDCNKIDFPVGTETCGGKSIKDFCPSSQKMSMPMPFRKTCGKQGSYNLKDIFEKSIAPVCGATSIQKFSLNVKLKYVMKIKCSDFLLRTLKNDIKERFINSIDTDWPDLCTSLCDNLEVTASCSEKAAHVQLAFTGLKMKIMKSDNSLSLSPEEILKITALQDDRLQFRDAGNADLQKNDVSFDQFPSCDNGSRILGQQCVECGPGSFFNMTTRICDLCPVGKYTASPKLTKCEDCGSGKTTIRAGSRNNEDCIATCSPGSYFETKESKCVECPRDFYQEESGKDYCLPCPLGNRTRNSGTVSKDQCFADCLSGTELLGSGTCKDCERGYYRTQTVNDACVQCPLGNITRKSGSMSRSDCELPDCPAGSYINDTELTCNKCPFGQYQPVKWMMKCLKCKPNYTTEIEGTSKESDCKFVCDPGKEEYPANSTTCRLCPHGTFRSDSLHDRFRACYNCSVNMTTEEEGAKNVSECSIRICGAGNYRNTMDNNCYPCPVGEYQTEDLQTECVKCPDNYTTKNEGSNNKSDCIFFCPDGYEVKSAVNESCRVCPRGTYRQNVEGKTFSQCMNCSDGNTTEMAGATSKDNCSIPVCEAGQEISSRKQCQDCNLDYYQPFSFPNSATECQKCNISHGTMEKKSTTSLDCKPYCSAGEQYNQTASECEPCPEGSWNNGNTSSRFQDCKNCPVNYTTTDKGSISPENCTLRDCPKGTKIVNISDCELCDFGQYQDMRHQNSCKECGLNKNTSQVGAVSFNECTVSCPPGKEGQNFTCNRCSDDKYKDKSGYDICMQCEGNFTSNKSRTTCDVLFCDKGVYYNSTTKSCFLCEKGTYKEERGNTLCTACPKNYTTPTEGASSPSSCSEVHCLPGFFSQDLKTCESCPRGTYKGSSGTENCTKCKDDKTTAKVGATSEDDCTLVVCDAGSFRNASNLCQKCPLAQYQAAKGQTSCKDCPDNYTTAVEGSENEMDCQIVCSKGYYRSSREMCTECPLGQYQERDGQDSCMNCTEGFTTYNKSSSSSNDCIKICDPGYYRKTTARDECTKCEIGSYQSKRGLQTSCTPCKKEKNTTLQDGSENEMKCMPWCNEGEYINTTTRTCNPCPLGFYRISPGTDTECISCPGGKTTANVGSTMQAHCSFDDCTPGYFRQTGVKGCKPCDFGYYQPSKSQSTCIPCSNGSTTLEKGVIAKKWCIEDCKSGQEYSILNKKCENCSIGSISVKTPGKPLNCDVCPPGQTTIEWGSDTCVKDLSNKPKPTIPQLVRLILKCLFSARTCNNADQVEGVITDTLRRIILALFTDWLGLCENEKCPNMAVRISDPCPRRRRRATGGHEIGAEVTLTDVPAILTGPENVTRNAKNVMAGAFYNLEKYKLELDQNNIKFEGLTNVTSQTFCAAGTELQNGKCVECDLGTKYVADTSVCMECPQGFYQDQRGQLSCKECGGLLTTKSRKTTNQSECISQCGLPVTPCKNGGSCRSTPQGKVSCKCTDSYTGEYCDTRREATSNLPVIIGGSVGGGIGILLLVFIILGIIACQRKQKSSSSTEKKSIFLDPGSESSDMRGWMTGWDPMPGRSQMLLSNPVYEGDYDFYERQHSFSSDHDDINIAPDYPRFDQISYRR